MFRRPSKKQLLIRRTIVSIVMIVAILTIMTGAVLFILGYRLDSQKGRLEQGALLQFDSTPSGAYVTIDGKTIGSRTATKQTVIAGSHTFIVSRDGYEQWAKSLTVKAGTLTWLDYIRLVPKNLQTDKISTYPSLVGEKASPDYKWLILQQKAEIPSFQLVDLRSQNPQTSTITLPVGTYSDATTVGVTHTFTLNQWDEGGRFVLVKHVYNEKTEWIVVDTQDVGTSVNITRLLSIGLSDLKFSGTSGNILYGLTNDGVIRKLDLGAATISRGLVTNVKNFDLFETNIITYIGIDPADSTKQVAGIYREGDESSHILRRTSFDTPLLIDATRYFSDDYVAIVEGLTVTVLKGRYPSSSADESTSLQTYATFTAPAAVDQLSFSLDGDYLIIRSGLGFISYEIEYQRQTNATVETSESKAYTLNWLDGAYVWSVYDGHLSIREFDGTNVHVIGAAEPGFDATLSQNGRYLYSITKSGATYQLQRVKMILD
ncbi:MAG: PEGA domain-containing protein [Candidatus Saccharimonadales bacterium]